MSSNNPIGNRNSTPEISQSSLRPPSSRGIGNGHTLRASADMSAFASSPLAKHSIRPASEVYYSQSSQQQQNHAGQDEAMEQAAQRWIADIDQYETTLEEMAAATLDQDFKGELSAIEQWFKVLCEAERTAALYALLQQTTEVQIRFFIQVLQEMAKNHPVSGILSPTSYNDKDSLNKRMSDATGKLMVEGNRNSLAGRPPPSPSNKRNSGLDDSTINAMFPEAAAAIANKRAEFTQRTGKAPPSNRNSTVMAGERTSLVTPTITGPSDLSKKDKPQPSPVPWGRSTQPEIPKSAGLQQPQPPMGQFTQPAPSPALRSARPPQLSAGLHPNDGLGAADLPMLSPYNANASWASLSNTPMVPNFNTQQSNNSHADMVANATAMKLAAMSTVNNRVMLDDPRKYRRTRSNDGTLNAAGQLGLGPQSPANVIVMRENGQLMNPTELNAQQLAALQLQQQAALMGRRSRPNSPGLAMGGTALGTGMGFTSPQNNGYLSAFDGSAGLAPNINALNLGQFGIGQPVHEGYISDHSDMARGRSPRGRRGQSKPPEDPTDMTLLQDIPAWLRSLRLHKYTDNLKDMNWKDLVQLDDKALEEKGVNALGARRKMLKTFEQVREAQETGRLTT